MVQTKFDIPTSNMGNDINNIAISVSYLKGGINYFNYKHENRGIYVTINPEKITHESGYTTRSFMMFSNGSFKVCVRVLNRKSQKQINEIAEKIAPHVNEIAQYVEVGDKQSVYDLLMRVCE